MSAPTLDTLYDDAYAAVRACYAAGIAPWEIKPASEGERYAPQTPARLTPVGALALPRLLVCPCCGALLVVATTRAAVRRALREGKTA